MSSKNYNNNSDLSQELLQFQISILEQQSHIEKLEAQVQMLVSVVCTMLLHSTRAGVDDKAIDKLMKIAREVTGDKEQGHEQ